MLSFIPLCVISWATSVVQIWFFIKHHVILSTIYFFVSLFFARSIAGKKYSPVSLRAGKE